MKKQTKIVVAVILAIVVAIGGYYGYKKHNNNTKVQTSAKIMNYNGVKLNSKDKAIVDEILNNDTNLEYAYITHTGNTVMLTIEFKKGVQDKEKASAVDKYMKQLKAQYEDKNINVKTMPSK